MTGPSKIISEIKNSTDKSGFAKLSAAFVIAILVVALNFFFLPISIAVINLAALIAIAALAITNYDRLARLSLEGGVKNLELETVIQNIRDGVLIYDPNFKILSLNRSAEKIFGLEAREVLGRTMEPGLVGDPHLRTITEIVFPSLAPSMTIISDADWPKIIDMVLDEPKMELRTVLNRISNVKGEVVGFLKIVTDLTREKAIIESKSEFIAVAAHQLRTPLTALNWSFESLNKILAEKDPDTKGAANIVKEGWQLTERSLRIVNDLLNAARIEGGRSGFNFEQVKLSDFLGTIVKQAEPIAKELGIKIELSAGAPGSTVKIDKELMGMALANLIDNGIKYNIKNGEVKITAGPNTNPGFVKVDISDTGVGIPQDGLSKIFQKFYRGSNVIQMEPNGSGLGLYITKNIIEGHGGKISVESQLGRGTHFSITLPLSP